MNKDAIRAKITLLREQMDGIAEKQNPTSDELESYKNLNQQVDALFIQLFKKEG